MQYSKPEEIYKNRSGQKDFCQFTDMPPHLIRILILIEDFSFYKHHGIVPKAILEAMFLNIKCGKHKFGGSTITQQLCKNLYFGCEISYIRKLSEMVRTFEMERKLTKNQILELYLNCVYFDNGTYGITEAAEYYFNEKPSELTFNQSFFLISLLPIVGMYNPLAYPEKFHKYMMNNARTLHRKHFITEEEMDVLMSHSPERLDEKLRLPDENTKKYSVHGPFINERYGPYKAIRDEEKRIICTVAGEGFRASDATQKAIANVIMNRIGVREWAQYKSAEEIIKHTGFNAYDFRARYYIEMEKYIEDRYGNKKFERIINNVLPVIRKEEKDITGGCVIFYSPLRYRIEQKRAGNKNRKVPDWDFSLLEKVRIPGVRGDFAFFRYKDSH